MGVLDYCTKINSSYSRLYKHPVLRVLSQKYWKPLPAHGNHLCSWILTWNVCSCSAWAHTQPAIFHEHLRNTQLLNAGEIRSTITVFWIEINARNNVLKSAKWCTVNTWPILSLSHTHTLCSQCCWWRLVLAETRLHPGPAHCYSTCLY